LCFLVFQGFIEGRINMGINVLNKKRNIIILVAVVIIVLFMAIILFYKITEIKQLDSEIEKITENCMKSIDNTRNYKKENDNKVNVFLGKLTAIILKTNNKIINVRTIGKNKIKENIYKYKIELNIEGEFYFIMSLFDELENYKEFCSIDDVLLVKEDNLIKVRMEISYIPNMNNLKIKEVLKLEKFKNIFADIKYNKKKVAIKEEIRDLDLKYAGIIDKKNKLGLIYFNDKGYVAKENDLIMKNILIKEIEEKQVILIRKNKRIVLKLDK